MFEPKWDQPNPSDLQAETDPPVPDTETLLAAVGQYPVVSYPAAQDPDDQEESAVDRTIFAGLVWP
jgi:hypothetical protein